MWFKNNNYDKWVLARDGEKALSDKVEPYIKRDASLLDVGDILVADGHKLAFQVINPFTGKPSRAKVFDLTIASSGNNEKQLKQKEIPYWKTYVYGRSHAGYYPNSDMILYKLLFSNDGKILGIQGIGESGVEKRVDVIATIMRNNGTVQEMIDTELCYAPPYSSAKDSVNILGMSADNIMGTIDGAINIPITEIRRRLDEIPKDKNVILSYSAKFL